MAAAKKAPAPVKRPVGRPPESVPADMAEEIIEWITDGNTLRAWCKQPGKPAWGTVYDWIIKDKEFSRRYYHARDAGEEAILSDVFAVAHQPPDVISGPAGDRLDPAYVAWQKNRVELTMKVLAKWNPKKYGEKSEQTLNHQGKLEVTRIEMVPMTSVDPKAK